MPTTLIVDDEMDIRMLVRVVLELAGEGFSVVAEAADGQEALDAWRGLAPPPVPDVIILDNRMPNMSGLEAAKHILEERPEQVIVLYSAFLDDEVKTEAESLGVAACISKNELQRLPELLTATLAERDRE